MIRRISKKNDLRDIIRSCPTGVIDDITSIKYYIQGYNTYIDVNFDKVGEQLIAVIPTSLLETLPNGILMRKASYRVVDSSYPDGYYNLEFEDNMNIWLGENESEEPEIPEYVTEDELSSTLSSYATMSWVSDQGYLTEHQDLSSYATKLWVSNQGYLTEVPSYFATQSWVISQGYITSETIPSDIATQSWVSTNFLSSTALTGYATQSWVSDQGYLTSSDTVFYSTSQLFGMNYIDQSSAGLLIGGYLSLQGGGGIIQGLCIKDIGLVGWLIYDPQTLENNFYPFATVDNVDDQISSLASWVSSNFLSSTALTGYATQSWVESQGYITSESIPSGIATQSWVESNFLSTTALNGYATQSWVSSNFLSTTALTGYATQSWVSEQGYLTEVPSYFATQSWVISQGYITSETIPSDIATQSWVSTNFLSSTALTGYATQSWVSEQGYLTSHQDLSSYATREWVSDGFLSTTALSGYATESWVSAQGYLTSHQNLSSYATKTWVSNHFFEESKIWTGALSEWVLLTPAQKAAYTIALVTE